MRKAGERMTYEMVTYDDVMLVFAKRLRHAIDRSGLTVKEIADRICVDRTTVYYYQQGNRLPGALNLRMLADLLNVSTDWLLGREERK